MENKVAGQPCSKCGNIYEMGKKGVYCKACYIQWKNAQTGTSGHNPAYIAPVATTAPNKATPEVDWDRISFGKCKHAHTLKMMEVYLKTNGFADGIRDLHTYIDAMEKAAEKLAKRDMRVLDKPQMSPIADQVDQDPFPEEPTF